MKEVKGIATFQDQLREVKEELKQEDEDLIQIGDHVNLNMIYGGEEPENMEVILTEKSYNLDNLEVSTSSPLGNLIHHKKIGFQGFYIVNNIKIDVIILNKITKQKKLTR